MSECENCSVRESNSLNSLTSEELIRYSSCKATQVIKKGETIFEEGEHINGVFCVKSGVCKISKMSENGREQIIHLIKKGDLLGERSLLNDEPTNLKATAISDMNVCFIPKGEVVNSLENNNIFTLHVLKNMAETLKAADNTIVDFGQKTVKQRLAHILLYLEKDFGKGKGNAIDIQLTREEIANLIGTATESSIRLLSEFKKKGYISLKGKEIIILDKNQLENVSNGI